MVARVKAVSAATVRDGIEVVRALAAYRATVVPVVREGLRGWERVAETIPDPVLREQALFSVREKGLNAEATAVFGILAPRRRRRQAVEAMTAFQVAVDYLEEGEGSDPEFLEQIRASATRFALGDGETRALDLRLVAR